MSNTTVEPNYKGFENRESMILFWGCFVALITTAFGFITRMFLLDDPAITQGLLNLDPAEVGRFKGIQIWPFAVSIIAFSLIIDRVGYKFSMIFAFVCQFAWGLMGVSALFLANTNPELASGLIFWGGLILALGNGTVEAFINPVVATMFDKDKTKWLNILHAGWPVGLVIAGVLTIAMGDLSWAWKLVLITIPAVIYFFMLIGCQFPQQERVAAGVTYREMLAEFGVLGATVVVFLLVLQLMDFFPSVNQHVFWAVGLVMLLGFGAYTKSFGRPLMFCLIVIMTPLATTEIGTDGWISGIMANAVTFHGGWILVYTALIATVLRFLSGPLVHKLSPLGLLMVSSGLASAGMFALAGSSGIVTIAIAATFYGIGTTFFWPTMLGVVSEQTPRGGALTLNAISGIGMLAVGTLGLPYIGTLQASKAIDAVAVTPQASAVPGLVENGMLVSDTLTEKSIYGIIDYQTLDNDALEARVQTVPVEQRAGINSELDIAIRGSRQKALKDMAIFPTFMLFSYILLWFYFKLKGGYKPVSVRNENP